MDEIRGRCGATYAFTRSTRTLTGPCAGDEAIARAVVEVFKGRISDVLVYRESNRLKGIGSAHYKVIEADIGRPLQPSKIRSAAGRKFWASRR
jgi:hypothetical protein